VWVAADEIEVTAYRDPAVDLAIMNLPHDASPVILEPLAAALVPLTRAALS
jgi:hypothetical protein